MVLIFDVCNFFSLFEGSFIQHFHWLFCCSDVPGAYFLSHLWSGAILQGINFCFL